MSKILIVDDDESMLETLLAFLSDQDYSLFSALDWIQGEKILHSEHPDLVITDLFLKEISGFEILKKTKEFDRDIPVIVITAFDNMDSTIQAIQFGAYDFLSKPVEPERLTVVVKRALETKKLSERLIIKISEESKTFSNENVLVGNSPQMKEIFKEIGHVSTNRVTVLVNGDTGTGKELISKIIHYSGITREHPFIAVNCSALSESLLESELFGHVKGAFTGAIRNKKGKFELAGEGTIFLDEISEISPALQVKLLRVIQEKEFEQVGGESKLKMNARIIASTNRDLAELVRTGSFREDLFYRLNVVSLRVPPLRERSNDIPQLVIHFLAKINRELHKNVTKVPYEVMEMLQNNDWVGNVRQLENVLTQAVVLSKSDVLEKSSVMLASPTAKKESDFFASLPSIEQLEKEYILYVLNKVNWDKKKAIKILGIAKTTLYNKLDQYKLKPTGTA